MGASNTVIAGDYDGKRISVMGGIPCIVLRSIGFKDEDRVVLSKSTIAGYDLINEDITKSAASGVTRGAVGAALLGPVGMLAGLSAKNKGSYIVAIKFKDGSNSLIEIDNIVYKCLIKACFRSNREIELEQQEAINERTTTQNGGNKESPAPVYYNTSKVPEPSKPAKKGKGCLIVIIILLCFILLALFAAGSGSEAPKTQEQIVSEVIGVDETAAYNIVTILNLCEVKTITAVEHDEWLDNAHKEGEKGYRVTSTDADNVILYLNPDNSVNMIRWMDIDVYADNTQLTTISNIKNQLQLE